jgi:hypothetical protein
MGRVYRTLCPGLLLISLTLVACGESPVTRRYRIERDMLRASRMDRQLQIRSDAPPTPESAREILKTYERVLSRNPLPTRTAPADTVIIHEIGRGRNCGSSICNASWETRRQCASAWRRAQGPTPGTMLFP